MCPLEVRGAHAVLLAGLSMLLSPDGVTMLTKCRGAGGVWITVALYAPCMWVPPHPLQGLGEQRVLCFNAWA